MNRIRLVGSLPSIGSTLRPRVQPNAILNADHRVKVRRKIPTYVPLQNRIYPSLSQTNYVKRTPPMESKLMDVKAVEVRDMFYCIMISKLNLWQAAFDLADEDENGEIDPIEFRRCSPPSSCLHLSFIRALSAQPNAGSLPLLHMTMKLVCVSFIELCV